MAFLYFAEHNVDVAILETGLGGRLDATNVVLPLFSMITEIGLDHTRILGKTLKSIAYEKGSIFKPSIPCLIGVNKKKVKIYFQELARNKTPLIFCQEAVSIRNIRLTDRGSWFDAETEQSSYPDLFLNLLGNHQVKNCCLVLSAVNTLIKQGWNIPENVVREGLKKVRWPARLDLLSKQPKILLDSAHNPIGIRSLVQALKTLFDYDRLILLFGVLKDKDYRKMIEPLLPLAQSIILTKPHSDRALDPECLLKLFPLRGRFVQVIPDIKQAWKTAIRLADKDDLVCGTGSMFLTGQLLHLWNTRTIKTKG
jgi:dihydrofolate synthase/folylpolyglutamate synthase